MDRCKVRPQTSRSSERSYLDVLLYSFRALVHIWVLQVNVNDDKECLMWSVIRKVIVRSLSWRKILSLVTSNFFQGKYVQYYGLMYMPDQKVFFACFSLHMYLIRMGNHMKGSFCWRSSKINMLNARRYWIFPPQKLPIFPYGNLNPDHLLLRHFLNHHRTR